MARHASIFPFFCLLIALPALLSAQGVQCTVTVNYESVPTANKDLLRDFATEVQNYVNSYQWGADVPDKVLCSMDIFIQSATTDNRYAAQVFFGSQRPIFRANRNTAVIRLKDDSWEFTYVRGRPISHNAFSFDDLTSFLDFYMYLIVAADGDTYDVLGGTPYFQKAQDIVRMSLSSGQKGWQQAATGYSRAVYIGEALLPKCEPIRQASFIYHFAGLDSLAVNPVNAQRNIVVALDKIGKAQNDLSQRSLMVKTFFETKYQEIATVLASYPDKSVFKRLESTDPSHQKTYDESLNKP